MQRDFKGWLPDGVVFFKTNCSCNMPRSSTTYILSTWRPGRILEPGRVEVVPIFCGWLANVYTVSLFTVDANYSGCKYLSNFLVWKCLELCNICVSGAYWCRVCWSTCDLLICLQIRISTPRKGNLHTNCSVFRFFMYVWYNMWYVYILSDLYTGLYIYRYCM